MNNCFTLPTGEYVPLENIDYIGPVFYGPHQRHYSVHLKSRQGIFVGDRSAVGGLSSVSEKEVSDSHKELCEYLEKWLENKNNKPLNK